ncbi:hypothetical protein FS837_009776 [Tulasnella sp. UAMH 9824]|nr:hypothetical protein FS837_009776 [Tulasnella sp. UAMH 9824]
MVHYYAVKVGQAPGIYKTWQEAEAQVLGHSGAQHRRFPSLRLAFDWVDIPLGQLASWVQEDLSDDLHRQGPCSPPPSGSISSRKSPGQGLEEETLSPTCLSTLQLGQRSAEGPLSSTPQRHPAAASQAYQDRVSPEISLQKRPTNHTYLKFTQPDYSVWSSTNHSGWFDDSLLSGIFHPPALGPRGSPSDVAGDNASQSEGEANIGESEPQVTGDDSQDIDPMLPSSTGLMGVPDENTWNHRIHLRAASASITHYTSGLRYVLGRHAANYLYMHYYSAGSAVAVTDAYLDYLHDGESFVAILVDQGMPPRHAAYLWTIISPEVQLGSSAVRKPYTPGEFSAEDDQDMSFIRSAS